MSGNVNDRMMKKLVEWRRGSVRGDKNQEVQVCKGEGHVIEEGQRRLRKETGPWILPVV